MDAPKIQPYREVSPKIYAYNTPGISYHEGWTKIGYTEKQSVEDRIAQQTHTAGIRWKLAWKQVAKYLSKPEDYFTDHEFHDFLEAEGVSREAGTEWFHIDGSDARSAFDRFADHEPPKGTAPRQDYVLRKEQADAVAKTKAYFEAGGDEFLWNAKPRFGKTLSAYDLIRQMKCQTVLIVTNRPSIANSWAEDFQKFIGWRGELLFVSETEAVAGKPGVYTRDEYTKKVYAAGDAGQKAPGMVAFVSLQDLKGSVHFGGAYDKLKWIADMPSFDLLIVDESQEGVETMKTERAFTNIKRKHTLYLSGTPFKMLARARFSESQLYNWSYADEQAAKASWTGGEANPYETLPRLSMYTYQLSPMITGKIAQGADLSDGTKADWAFDLNEFFSTKENGRFVHEEEVKKFLRSLTTNEKYPFSTEELRAELSHTLWIMDRVAGAKAMARMLQSEEFREIFGDYDVIVAAGDGKLDDEAQVGKAYDRVKDSIRSHEKTITLSVGQLTVGVTVPEWSGVLMLCNMKSPSSYMQAAFRAQNPCIMTRHGKRYRKENAYVFDFDPARTLIIFEQFANDLASDTAGGRGTSDDRKKNIRQLLNFFPVLGEDTEGKMVALDAAQVLSIPRKLKSEEVVRRGFLSNFLFQNIGNVFGAPGVVRDILQKLAPAQEEAPRRNEEEQLDSMDEVCLDENGEPEIPEEVVIGRAQEIFGKKRYAEADIPAVPDVLSENAGTDEVSRALDEIGEKLKAHAAKQFIAPAVEEFHMKKSAANRLHREKEQEIDRRMEIIKGDFRQASLEAKAAKERRDREAETKEALDASKAQFEADMAKARDALSRAADDVTKEVIEKTAEEVTEKGLKYEAEEKQRIVEDDIRARLRGFSRTIPSFLMAYGDAELTLANFDRYTESDVFKEVTGITLDDFRFLRDGGDRTDPATGEAVHFEGHLFDEVVFNDSVQEFLKKKEELADYFDESHKEDIFDYIPPQKTNQIFTPREVVRRMVDALEENNPGCFDDPKATFADLYMKSGLYITEIVKRLFRSETMKALYPDDGVRIRHILRHQVYGMAPTRIIYLIAMNYILGFDESLRADVLREGTAHFVCADAAAASKEGKLAELVKKYFG